MQSQIKRSEAVVSDDGKVFQLFGGQAIWVREISNVNNVSLK